MALAETATIGVRARPSAASAARICRVASTPLIPGIWMSIRIMSQLPPRQASIASRPLDTRVMSTPRGSSRAARTFWLMGLSSAARIRTGASDASGEGLEGGAASDVVMMALSPSRSSGRQRVKVEPSPGVLSTSI